MPKADGKMKSWQVLFYFRKHRGRSALYRIFGKRHARTIDGWCEDPRFTDKDERAYDPIQGVKEVLEELDDHGHCDVVRAAVAYIISGTSLDCGIDPQIVDIKPTITEEILADYKAVAALQHAIEAAEYPDHIITLKQAAIAEIERTFAKYREDFRR